MRFLLVLCFGFYLASSSALGQQNVHSGFITFHRQRTAPQRTAPHRTALRQTALQQTTPQQTTPQQTTPQQTTPQRAAPPSDPFNDDPEPLELDDPEPLELDLDSTQSYNFDESDDYQNYQSPSTSNSAPQSSIASNSNFRGASPQMIGDFGGGSTMLSLGGNGVSNSLSVPLPLAGGSRRIKIAENNQVMPLDRVYGTFNYFHNSSQAVGAGPVLGTPVTVVDSESLLQYTVGFEKTFYCDLFSVDVRMPFTGGVDQRVNNVGPLGLPSAFALETGEVGNLSTTIKALLLRRGQTLISGGLQISIPTGSDVNVAFGEFVQDGFVPNLDFDPTIPAGPKNPESVPNIVEDSGFLNFNNDAVHLMPFIGAYRPFGDSWWLQAFAQIDTPTGDNDFSFNEVPFGSITEQTLLYADISLGKWLYRNRCNSARYGRCGVTGIASILELHYTGALNDSCGCLGGVPGAENRFDVLNLTAGLQVEISEQWRINIAGAFPLREGRFEEFGGRREDRFFDSEFSLHVNRFF